jgi:hypothetical protein
MGKHGMEVSKAVLMEYSEFLPHLAMHLHPSVPPPLREKFSSMDLYQYAQKVPRLLISICGTGEE